MTGIQESRFPGIDGDGVDRTLRIDFCPGPPTVEALEELLLKPRAGNRVERVGLLRIDGELLDELPDIHSAPVLSAVGGPVDAVEARSGVDSRGIARIDDKRADRPTFEAPARPAAAGGRGRS